MYDTKAKICKAFKYLQNHLLSVANKMRVGNIKLIKNGSKLSLMTKQISNINVIYAVMQVKFAAKPFTVARQNIGKLL